MMTRKEQLRKARNVAIFMIIGWCFVALIANFSHALPHKHRSFLLESGNIATGGDWTPAAISDCAVWYRSDMGAVLSGASVAQWNDQSGNARNLTPGAAATRPTLTAGAVNGHAAVTFDGADDYLSNAFGIIAQPFHVFWVGKQVSNTANEGIHGSATWGERSETIQAGVHNIAQYAGGAGNKNTNGGWIVGEYELVASLFSGVSSSIIVNNDATVASGENPGTNGHDGLILGALFGPINFGNVAIAEFVIYSKEVTGAELTVLRTYFNNRYGLW